MENFMRMREETPGVTGFKHHVRNLEDELKELGRLRTAIMMEKCQNRTEVVSCPVPRKGNSGSLSLSSGRYNELKAVEELSDILVSQASPRYFAGSPPIRASNPLIQDAHFHAQRVQSGSQVPLLADLDSVNYDHTNRSILSTA